VRRCGRKKERQHFNAKDTKDAQRTRRRFLRCEAPITSGPDIQWVESYVAADKTFCVYLAKDEDIIKKRAEISGFPATRITEVRKMIDPTTEHAG
jgi:hypothetical protein